ncbi:Hypothetical predicted protein [Mytilus galloprovincialis]|uniref:BTB domain-containing protein n=1 Tax=Mytilus galloprovincialis TaxID=29158 RepID=A0A8B6DG88_MYTGA|nr:Hypothetical predicted protein [Mytilus galloprovincialis]
MMLGREITLPVDLVLGVPEEEIKIYSSNYAYELAECIQFIHEFARKRLKISGQTMKKYYDHKIYHKLYDVGSCVWLHNPKPKRGLSRKLQNDWCGPFVITHKLNDVIYRVQETPRSKPKVVHHDKLKMYTGSKAPTWKTVVRRHLIEQHSGVSHRCDSCFKFLGRADQKHGTCDARTQTTTLVVRQSGLTGEEAKKVLIGFRQTVDDKILARLLPQENSRSWPKGKKRPSSEPGFSKTKKWQGQVIATTSPLARVAPPNPPSYVTSRTLGGKHISVTQASSRPRPTPCRVTATVVREPSPTPIEAEEPANSVSGDTALNPSLASDVEDGEVVDQVSIGVGPQETLEVPSIPLPSIRVEEPTPQSPAVTPRPTQDRAEAVPAIEPARRVVWDHLASQRVTDVKLAGWSDVQSGRVVLDIGGTRFVTSKATLKMEPSSLLAEMVQEGSTMRPFRKDEHGSPMYFLDRDPAHFRHILNYLRLGSQWSSQSLPRVVRYLYDLRAETDHFQLQGLHDHINRRITTLIESEYDVNL